MDILFQVKEITFIIIMGHYFPDLSLSSKSFLLCTTKINKKTLMLIIYSLQTFQIPTKNSNS